jgi:hypothetical protein
MSITNRGGVRSLSPPKSKPPVPRNPLCREISTYISDGDVKSAVKVLRKAMTATKNERCGKNSYVEVIDHGVRLNAAKMILEYTFGKPNVRIAVSDPGPNGGGNSANENPADVARRLKASGLNVDDILDAYTMAATPAQPAYEDQEETG